MSALQIKARNAFAEKLVATMAHLLRSGELVPEKVAAEVALDLEEVAVEAFAEGLAAGIGSEMAAVAMADLTGHADRSNSAMIGGRLTRAAVSKTLIRVRRHLGMQPTRCPKNARRKPTV